MVDETQGQRAVCVCRGVSLPSLPARPLQQLPGALAPPPASPTALCPVSRTQSTGLVLGCPGPSETSASPRGSVAFRVPPPALRCPLPCPLRPTGNAEGSSALKRGPALSLPLQADVAPAARVLPRPWLPLPAVLA